MNPHINKLFVLFFI